jgi:hypothetical protein
MRTKSPRIALKCTLAVKHNITAKPARTAAGDFLRQRTPSCLASRASNVALIRTMRGATGQNHSLAERLTSDLNIQYSTSSMNGRSGNFAQTKTREL